MIIYNKKCGYSLPFVERSLAVIMKKIQYSLLASTCEGLIASIIVDSLVQKVAFAIGVVVVCNANAFN